MERVKLFNGVLVVSAILACGWPLVQLQSHQLTVRQVTEPMASEQREHVEPKEVAERFLSKRLLLSPVETDDPHLKRYQGRINDQTCRVTLADNTRPAEQEWLVTDMSCQ